MSNFELIFKNIDEGQVHVWRIALMPTDVMSKLSLLSDNEKERAKSFSQDILRDRFIVSHYALRKILGGYLNCAAQEVSFTAGPFGKPRLDRHFDLNFNLSHSRSHALIAITLNADVGVDLECIRQLHDLDAFVSRFFTQGEVAYLSGCPSELRLSEFFRIWTAKEAYLKARGVGLVGELNNFEITACCDSLQIRQEGDAISDFFIAGLSVEPGYAGALAIARTSAEIRYLDWNDDE